MKILVASDDHAISQRVCGVLLTQQLDCPAGHVVSLDLAADRAGRIQPNLLIFVLPASPQEAYAVLRETRDVVLNVHTFALGPVSDPKLILETLKQGADEFLDWDSLDTELPSALARFQNSNTRLAAQRKGGRIITLLSPSGGSGGSMLATSISVVLAQLYRECGLIDLRLGVGDLTHMLNLRPARTLADLCDHLSRLDQSMFEQFLLGHESGVHLLAAPTTEGDLRRVTGKGVRRALTLARARFSSTVVDLDRTFAAEQVEVMWQADAILLVLRLDYTSVRAARRTIDTILGLGITREHIRLVVNGYGQRRQLELEQAEAAVGMKIAHHIPHDSATVNLAINNGVPVVLQSRFTRITRSIRALAQSVNNLHHEHA